MVDITRLRRFKILQSLSDDKLAELAPQFGEELRPRNEIIFREGEPGDFFYLIESGQVSARKQQAEGDEFLGYFLAGDFFGERALLTDEGRYATVDAVLQVALLTLSKDDFLALCEAHPPVRAAIEAVAAERDRRRMVTFPGRRLDEALIIATHRHIVWVAARALRWSLAVGVPWLVASAFLQAIVWVHPVALTVYLGGLVWYYLDWRNDWFVVSSKRVLHHEKTILFFDKEEEAALDKISNVTSEVWGVVGNFLNVGTVTIQTAAGGGRIVFDMAPRFRVIRDAIEAENQREITRLRQDQLVRARDGIRKELLREIGLLETSGGVASAPGPAVQVKERAGIARRVLGHFTFIAPTYVKRGEDIIWRKHIFLLYRDLAAPVAGVIALVMLTASLLTGDFGSARPPIPVVLAVAALGALGVAVWFWYEYRDWENDIYILTPTQLTDSERKPFWLQERVKVANLGQVQNVRYERKSILENILDFGTVVIETAGTDGGLTFDEIPHPRQAQAQISDALDRFKARQRQSESEQKRREFLDWFGEYHRLLTEGEVDI